MSSWEETHDLKKEYFWVGASLTCAGLLVFVEFESFVAVAGEDTRSAEADLLTVVLPLGTQVDGW